MKWSPVALLLLATPASAASIHQFSGLALSPRGDLTATIESDDAGNLAEEPHGTVVVRDAQGEVVADYDPCAGCRYSGPAFSPKDGSLVFLAADDKSGKTTLYRALGSRARPLAAISGVANTARYSADGSRIAFLATIGARKKTGATQAAAPETGEIGEKPDEQRIAVLPATGGALKLVSPSDTYIYEFSWAPNGKGFAATAATGNGDDNWWIATLDYVGIDGRVRVIAAPKMQINMPRVSPNGRTVAFIGGLMSDWGAIGGDVYTVPLAGGSPSDVTRGYKGSFEGIVWRAGNILGTAQIEDRSAAVAIDPVAGKVRTLWSDPVSVSSIAFNDPIAFSDDGSVAATVSQDFTHAPEILRGRLPGLSPVTSANASLPASVIARSVHWKNQGYDVEGWLLSPLKPGPGKHPMITIVHGGPSAASRPRYIVLGGQHGTGFDFVGLFIRRGYFVFYPNPRGSYGEGEAFT
ncbi:MAG: S9 family peptidase, partial [Rhizomicrobium sp.]